MFADYHIHTNYSPDSNIDMEECVILAINLKLDEICFTDHIDYGAAFCYCCDTQKDYDIFIAEKVNKTMLTYDDIKQKEKY